MTAPNLITDLLALSKLTKTSQPFQKINLIQPLNRALANLEDQLGMKQADIKVDQLVTLNGAPIQLEQLFRMNQAEDVAEAVRNA